MDGQDWSSLPQHVLTIILGHLPLTEAYRASLTCRPWFTAFQSPKIWRKVEFAFTRVTPEDEKYFKALEKFGEHFRNVTVLVEQGEKENRRLAVKFLMVLADLEMGKMNRFTLEFIGTNPLFYGGQEFVDALLILFNSSHHNLEYIDLNKTPVMYTDELFLTLSSTAYSTLRYLNIQTKQFICKIQPECMLTLAVSCKKLVDLRLCHSSLSNEVLLAFATGDNDRDRLKHLSILCRRQEKYFHHDLTETTWLQLTRVCPELEVTLKFDPTCPLEKAREILKPPIPVKHLYMEMNTNAHEIALATEYYHGTLTKFVIQGRPTPMLEAALLDAAEWCGQLRSLHVMCLLTKETVEDIMRRRPELMRDKTEVTLKYDMEAHPWVTDEQLDQLPVYV